MPCAALVREDPVRGGTASPAWARGRAATRAAVGAFQLALFTSSPRVLYPTLSWLAGAAFDVQGIRIVGFATWLWVGWWIVER